MTRFAESPVPYLLIGLAVESILLILYVQTRRGWVLGVMVLVLLLTAAGVIGERVVVTDREAVEQAVYDLAAAVEANDLPAVLNRLSPLALQARLDAQQKLALVEVELARVVGPMEITFFRDTPPPTARVEFRAVARVKESRSGMAGGGAFDFVLTFRQEDGKWLLLGYTYQERR